LVNELSWYEDTKIKLSVEGDELILSEQIDWQKIHNSVWYWSKRIILWLKDLQ
jgi:hypothetical protein